MSRQGQMWSDVLWSELGPSWVENWKTSWGCLWYAIFFGDTSKVEANLWGCTWSISNFYEIQWVSDAQYDHVTSIQARLRSRRGWSFNKQLDCTGEIHRPFWHSHPAIPATRHIDSADRCVSKEGGIAQPRLVTTMGSKHLGQQFGDSTMTSWSRTRQTRIDLIMIHLQLKSVTRNKGSWESFTHHIDPNFSLSITLQWIICHIPYS